MYVRSPANLDGTADPLKYGPKEGLLGGLEVISKLPWNEGDRFINNIIQTIPVYECE